jgi:hypothetical protein
VKSIDPIVVTFPRIGAAGDAPVLWLEVEETATLRELHTRINQELVQRFPKRKLLLMDQRTDFISPLHNMRTLPHLSC